MTRAMPDLHGRVVPADRLTQSEISTWQRLCLDARLHSPFYSYGYVRSVAEVRPHVYVCVLQNAEGPVAYFPFQFANELSRVLGIAERVGGDLSDYFGPIAPGGFALDIERLLTLAGLQCIFFTHLAEHFVCNGFPGQEPRAGLVIDLSEGLQPYWRDRVTRNARVLSDTDRCARNVVRDLGSLRFRFDDRDPAVMQHLIAAKRDQYNVGRSADPLAPPWTRALLASLNGTRDPDCTPVVSTLYAGDTWLASHVGLRRLDVLHYWFPVYNRNARKYAPGRLLLREIINASPGAGIRSIDCGEGIERTKVSFANRTYMLYRGVWKRRGWRSACAEVLPALRWRYERVIGRLFAQAERACA